MSKKIKSTPAQQQSKRASSQPVCGFDTTPMFFKAIVVKSDHPEVKEFGVRTRTENDETDSNEQHDKNTPSASFGPFYFEGFQRSERPRKAVKLQRNRIVIATPASMFKLFDSIEAFLTETFRVGYRLGKLIWRLIKFCIRAFAILWGIPATFTFVMLLLRAVLPEFVDQVPDIYNAIDQVLAPYTFWPFNALVEFAQKLLSADVSELTANELALREFVMKIRK